MIYETLKQHFNFDSFLPGQKEVIERVVAGKSAAAVNSPRERVITALEYFDDKGWIELSSRSAVEVYEIQSRDFSIDELSQTLYSRAKQREDYEIKRIHNMVKLFESETCLSAELSRYFGENLKEHCGTCSVCTAGAATLPSTIMSPTFSDQSFSSLTAPYCDGFRERMGHDPSTAGITRFLCGISSPVSTRLKMKNLPQFGSYRDYPFQQVKSWVERNYEGKISLQDH